MSRRRSNTITQKIPREATGLAGAIYVHVSHDGAQVTDVRISTRWRDGAAFDSAMHELGDTISKMIRDLRVE